MGVTKRVIKSNRLLVKNGNLIVVDQMGKKYRRFNRRSAPAKTEVFERERFRMTVRHAIAIVVIWAAIIVLTILAK